MQDPQHVAFATADLFATTRALRERGARLLTVSNNYYEDLDARFALDSGAHRCHVRVRNSLRSRGRR